MSLPPWFTPEGLRALTAVTILDFLVALGRTDMDLAHSPAILVETLELGGAAEFGKALATQNCKLVQDATRPTRFEFVKADGTVMNTTNALRDLSDAISRGVEPQPVVEGVAAPNGGFRYEAAAGPLWVHLDPLVIGQEVCAGVVAMLQRLAPAATATDAATPTLSGAAASPSVPAGRMAHGHAVSGSGLDVSFLDNLIVTHTACDSGEDFMAPFEVSFAANGAANQFTVPDVYNFRAAHIDYMTSPETYNCRTFGRTILNVAFDLVSVPSHEVVHLLQHAGGQVDRSTNSWQAEHDAAWMEAILLLGALQELATPAAATAAAATPTTAAAAATGGDAAVASGGDGSAAAGDAPAGAATTNARRRQLQPPPAFLGPLCMLHSARVAASVRAKPAFQGPAFLDVCRGIMGGAPVTSSGSGSMCKGAGSAVTAVACAISGACTCVAASVAVVGSAVSADAATAAASAAVDSSPAADGGAPASEGGSGRLFAAFRRWMDSFGLWNPAKEMEECGAEAYEDDAFKLLCGVEGCAGMLLGDGSGSDGSAAVTRRWSDALLHRMLVACLRGRTGDVHAAAAREVLYENLAHARIPRADDGTALGFLRPVTDASALAEVAASLAAAASGSAASVA